MASIAPPRSPSGLTAELARLAGPIVVLNLSYVLLGVTDTFFMGRLGKAEVAGVGLAVLVYLTPFLLLRGGVNSVVPFVARAFGAGELDTAGRELRTHLWLAVILGVASFAFLPLYAPVYDLIGADARVHDVALAYTRVRALEVPFALLATTLMSFRVALGDSRTPMVLAWGGVLANVVLAYAFIFGHFGLPALGPSGAALGTALSVALQAVAAAVIVLAPRERRKYGIHFAWPRVPDLRRALRVGLPLGLMDCADVGAFAAFLSVIARVGTTELAASQIANQVASLAFQPGFALGTATASLVGRFLGAREPDRARRVALRGVALGVAWMGFMGVLFFLFGSRVVGAFNRDDDVVRLGASLLRFMAGYQMFDAVAIVLRGALLGAGDTRLPMLFTAIGGWAIMVPGAWLLAIQLEHGLFGAWSAAFAFIASLAIAVALRFRSGAWARTAL